MKDVQLLVLTDSGILAGHGELGEIYVRSPHLSAGFVPPTSLYSSNDRLPMMRVSVVIYVHR